jgi:large subunit ribosomal protein L23
MATPLNIYPRATEKAYGLSKGNIYVFDVPLGANKKQILEAVQVQFNVKAIDIKTLVQNGKSMRSSTGKRSYPKTTYRKDTKKAYVTLAEGNSIKVFEEAETADKATKKEKK